MREWISHTVTEELSVDVGTGDITAHLIPVEQLMQAKVITREPMVVCGVAWVNEVFRQVDSDVVLNWQVEDGQHVDADSMLFELSGNARSIVIAERVALNGLQTFSGIATTTSHYVAKLAGTDTKLLDTRKTIPGLRLMEKYAVTCGGGHNHRMGLYDQFLIKENHIASCSSIAAAVTAAEAMSTGKLIEVEVESLAQLQEALDAGVTRIMLDNFAMADIHQAVQQVAGKAQLEISGNVSLDNIAEYAKAGVDYISVGALTKNVRAVDLSLRIL